jgi:hypothetical protein
MKNKIVFAILILPFVFTSCNKCDPSNSEGGLIIKDAIVRVVGGDGGSNFITSAGQFNAPIEISLDGGLTYQSVDYSEYSVFSLPTNASCSSGYNRSVTTNEAVEVVTYSIVVTECDYCEGTTNIENWVLTSAVPSNYTVVYDIQKN